MSHQQDSPLSITSSIAGILTFSLALLAAIYARLTYLRNADTEYFQVKTSVSWYKTESTFMRDLIRGSFDEDQQQDGREGARRSVKAGKVHDNGRGRREREMYGFVMEQLGTLEERLLECLADAEDRSQDRTESDKPDGTGWTIIPRRMRGRTDIAMGWLPVRAKALELVRQRDALGIRVLFAQLSLVGSKVREQEMRSKRRDEKQKERLDKLEKMVVAQNEKLDHLQDLVYRVMHRDRVHPDASLPETAIFTENIHASTGLIGHDSHH